MSTSPTPPPFSRGPARWLLLMLMSVFIAFFAIQGIVSYRDRNYGAQQRIRIDGSRLRGIHNSLVHWASNDFNTSAASRAANEPAPEKLP